MKKKYTKKKVFGKFIYKIKSFKWKILFHHLLTMLSLLPILVALWMAIPTFTFHIGSHTIEVTNILSKYSTNLNTYGFKKGYDLQNGTSIEYTIHLSSDKAKKNKTPSKTSTGEVSLGKRTNMANIDDEVTQTISMIKKRVDSSQLADRRIQKFKIDNNTYKLIVNLSGTREGIGTALPTLFPLRGNTTIWIDDPSYTSTGAITDRKSFLEGKIKTDILQKEILSANTVNDAKTNGKGIQITFSSSGINKIIKASELLRKGQNKRPTGFVIVTDGIPIMIQSRYAKLGGTSLYFIPLNQDDAVIRTMVTIVNQGRLPLKVGFADSNSNVTSTPTQADMQILKISLLAGFIIFNLFLLYRYREGSIPLIVLNIGVVAITVATYKLFRSYLTIELLLGTFSGVFLVYYFVRERYDDILDKLRINAPDKTVNILKELKRSMLFFTIFPLAIILYISSIFAPPTLIQIMIGIDLGFISGVIVVWTAFSTFIYEFLIIPAQYAKKNNRK